MMKFDHVVMNPPYDGNLHLKVVQEAMKHSDDVVNLSPIRWLQDPLAEYKKNSDWKRFSNLRPHFKELEIIQAKDTNKLFNIQWGDLGIYHLTKEGGLNLQCKKLDSVSQKMLNFALSKRENSFEGHLCKDFSGHFIHVLDMYGGDKFTGSFFVKPYGYEKPEASTSKGENNARCMKFETKDEAINFSNASRSFLYRFYASKINNTVRYNMLYFPYLGDYTHPWDDAALYKYFGLTQEEISLIEEEMKGA